MSGEPIGEMPMRIVRVEVSSLIVMSGSLDMNGPYPTHWGRPPGREAELRGVLARPPPRTTAA